MARLIDISRKRVEPARLTVFLVHGYVQDVRTFDTAFKDAWESLLDAFDAAGKTDITWVSLSYDPRVSFESAAATLAQGLRSVSNGTVLLVSHGCGGLVVRQSLVMIGAEDAAALTRLKGVLYVSPPFLGFKPENAALMKKMRFWEPVDEYVQDGVGLSHSNLRQDWKHWQEFCMLESVKTASPWGAKGYVRVVDDEYALVCVNGFCPVARKDHFSILQTGPTDMLFLQLRSLTDREGM